MTDAILVIGGGIAGINCAMNAAKYGAKVYLVDDTPSIGGMMARLDKTFPTNDCSICIEAPQMYEVDNHERIEILTNAEVRRVQAGGRVFKVRLLQKPRFVDESKCTGCGACVGGCAVDCSQCRECPIALCVKACEKEGKKAVTLWQANRNIDIEVKSIVVATGIRSAPPAGDLLGYDRYPNVITNTEFERLMNAGGPTAGHIIRPSDRQPARRIAWVQCAGRGLGPGRGTPYCSKVCCMIAIKQTIIAKEHDPSVEAAIFYNDLKAHGKGFWDFHRKALENGVRFVRARPYAVSEDPATRDLAVRYEDLDTGELRRQEVDLLVLSTGLIPGDRNERLAKVLKIELDHLGFFKERDPILAPLETIVEGIYLCGGATGPIDIAESVTQAAAAAMKAVLMAS